MKPSTRRLPGLLAVVAVVIASALVLPSAFGAVRPDDRGGLVGVGRAAPVAVGLVGMGQIDASTEPVLRGVEGAPVAEQSSNMDWTAILVGVGVVALTAAVAVAAVETARHHGGPRRTVSH